MADSTNSKKENEVNASADNMKTVQKSETANQTNEQKNDLADKVGSAVSGDTKAAKDIYDQAKKATGEVAGKVYDAAADKATSKIDEEKTVLAQGVSNIADSIRQIGDSLRDGEEQSYGIAKVGANYSNKIADQVEQISSYLENRELGEILNDLKKFAHRNPSLFMGGAFVVGIAAARFFKSGNSNQSRTSHSRSHGKEIGAPENSDKQTKLSGDQTKNTAASTDKSVSAASSNKGA